MFYLGSMTDRAWQEPGKRKEYPVKRYTPKINVWAAAGTYMKSQLYFFKDNMNGPFTKRLLRPGFAMIALHLRQTLLLDCLPTMSSCKIMPVPIKPQTAFL